MAKIKENRTTYTDTMDKIHKDENGRITCCGRNIMMVSHIDGIDFYDYNYQCECGNCINAHTKRDEYDKELWGEV